MRFEVEQKHRIHDWAQLQAHLQERNVALGASQTQVDIYFNHPSRDFAQTDEALRIRQTSEGNCVTYKGPKLGTTSKTRREIELSIQSGSTAAQQFGELLELLSFVRVAEVHKGRRGFLIRHKGHDVIGAIDDVSGVGLFAELEISADRSQLDASRAVIAELAQNLQLGPEIRESYLEMKLERQEGQAGSNDR